MNKINRYYDKFTMSSSPEEMAQRVINADNAARPNRVKFKKPAVFSAAAAVLIVGGVTAGAATGIFNFNEIFSSISAEDDTLGEQLMGNADNIRTDISDDDYIITLNGVTGSPISLLANIKIARADGKPITKVDSVYFDVQSIKLQNSNSFGGGGYFSAIGQDGALSIDWTHSLSYDNLLRGKVLTDGTVSLGGNVSLCADNEIVNVDWTIDFDYTPSEESIRTAKAVDVSENCSLKCYKVSDETEHPTVDCDIYAMVLTDTVGVINCNMLSDEFVMPIAFGGNDIKLIKKDGTEIKVMLTSGSGSEDDSINFIMTYYEDNTNGKTLAVDVSDIEAVSINGTTYTIAH